MRTRFLGFGIILLTLLVLMEVYFPKPVQWDLTLSSDDEIPYGTYILKESMSTVFLQDESRISRFTFYEIADSVEIQSNNYLSLARQFNFGKEEMSAILEMVESGSNVILSAYAFGDALEDSLNIETKDAILQEFSQSGNPIQKDSSFINLKFPGVVLSTFFFKTRDLPVIFKIENENDWAINGWNYKSEPILISRKFGNGKLILSCVPAIFTNYYLLKETNAKLASEVLSMMPPKGVHWTEVYSRGRPEPRTPLRYILATPPLKWAYYLLIISLIIFIFFEAKRQQRAIPIVHPPPNDSMEFVKTVGNLYFEKGDHKNIASKKILHLLDHIRTNLHLPTNKFDTEFYDQLSKKSGYPVINVEGLFTMIEILNRKEFIDAEELITLNRKIEAFLQNHYQNN